MSAVAVTMGGSLGRAMTPARAGRVVRGRGTIAIHGASGAKVDGHQSRWPAAAPIRHVADPADRRPARAGGGWSLRHVRALPVLPVQLLHLRPGHLRSGTELLRPLPARH